MTRCIVIIALLISVFANLRPAPGAAQAEECTDLKQYFATADTRLAEGFIALLQDGEWMSRMDAAATKASHSDLSILVLSPDEMEAFVTFISVPGDVLLSMEEHGEVPKVADELHSTALQIWLLYPPMMRSIASGSIFGAFLFTEEFESLEAENLQAQKALDQSCPDEVDDARALAEEDGQVNDWFGILEFPTTPQVFKGMSFDMLFFADSGSATGIPASPIQSSTEEASNIAAAQTEVAESRATLSAQETQVATTSATATTYEIPPVDTATIVAEGPASSTSPRDIGTPISSPPTGPLDKDELFALLPDSSIMPEGLDQVTNSTRTEAEVVTALGGSRDAEARLKNWGWTANVEREFMVSEYSDLPLDATTDISVSLHGFSSEKACSEALVYFFGILDAAGYEEADEVDIGAPSLLMVQELEDGGTVVALYVQYGSVLYRIGGFSPSGDPTSDVLNVAKQLIDVPVKELPPNGTTTDSLLIAPPDEPQTGTERIERPTDGNATAEGESTDTAASKTPTDATSTDESDSDASGEFTLSDAPFYSDGTLWGPADARLGYDDGVIFSANPDGDGLDRDDVEVQVITGENGQSLAVCANGDCTDATSASADGPHTDEPIGWVDGRLIYQRTGTGPSVELRAVEWNGEPIADAALGTIDTPVTPLGTAYPVDAGTLVPTASAWLLITRDTVTVVDQNPYGEVRLVRTNFGGDDLITYVAGGQLLIASTAAPGSPMSAIPFNGVDYDLSERNQAVVISTGSGLEIRDLGGSLIAASDTTIATGSVLWLREGIVFIDQTNAAIRLLVPAMLRQ